VPHVKELDDCKTHRKSVTWNEFSAAIKSVFTAEHRKGDVFIIVKGDRCEQMKPIKRLITAGVLICMTVLLTGCVTEPIADSVEIKNVTTDRETYHSGEIMNITVALKSATDVSGVYANVSGITNKRGKNMLFKETTTNLTRGLNNVTFTYKMPACSSCSGISEGTYHFNASVVYGSFTAANSTYSVILKQ
jgi:hypothetical protein